MYAYDYWTYKLSIELHSLEIYNKEVMALRGALHGDFLTFTELVQWYGI